jgi:resuscitation-promoting factor RpfA
MKTLRSHLRTQALLAASLLVLSAAAPIPLLAAEPDQEQTAAPAPDQTAGDPSASPGFDPGGGSAVLPFDDASSPQDEAAPGPGSGEPGGLDQETGPDTGAPTVVTGDEPTNPEGPPDSLAPPEPLPSPLPAAQPAPTSELPGVTAPEPGSPAASPPSPTEKVLRRPARERRDATSAKPVPRQQGTGNVAPGSALRVSPAPVQSASSAPILAGGPAEPGDRIHVVIPGESLWSIAADYLGDDASALRIAHAVHAVWERNKDTIATGDPDLLMVGTRLRLR